MKQKVIFHIDVNSAFLAWDAVYRLKHLDRSLDLREIPSAVGGDISKRRGIILAKSTPAKKYNITTGEPVTEALRKCPNLVLVPPNYELYEKSSKAFMEVLRDYSDMVEQYSIDEAFVDMSGTELLFGAPVIVAHEMKDRIYKELGFSVNIGVSSNKLLAKMASDFQKPNRVHTLFPEEIEQKMWHLPVRELFFVGKASEKKLYKLGITTIGELAKADIGLLKLHLKKQGEIIWKFANGIDVAILEQEPTANKGYGNSTTISFDVEDAGIAKMILLSLAESVGKRLRKDGVKIEMISISIKDFNFKSMSHQRTLPHATNITNEVHQVACELLEELWDGTPIRHLGIHTSRIATQGSSRQLSLFEDNDYEKMEKLDQAIDSIREKYGSDAVKRATFIENKEEIDHITGGVSREKRTVDYENDTIGLNQETT